MFTALFLVLSQAQGLPEAHRTPQLPTPSVAQATSKSLTPSSATNPTRRPSTRNLQFGRTSNFEVDLGDVGHDMEIDEARGLIYVSVPVRNEIVVIDMATFSIVDNVFVGTRPHGIDISDDGKTLYCALHQASSVAYLDLDTRLVTDTINIGTLLDHSTTWDVAEGAKDRIFVSANPGSGGFAYIVEIDRGNGNAAQRVASNRIIRAGPTFSKSPDRTALYVGSGFSPNSFYKLSMILPNAPIILEDNHGSVSGTQHADISPDGSRAYLRSGQILSTSDFSQVGLIGGGPSRINSDGSVAYVAKSMGIVEFWDTTTQLQAGGINFPCSSTATPQTLRILPNDSGVATLVGGFVCGQAASEQRSLLITPGAGPVISSQAFDVCLIMDPGSAAILSIQARRNGVDISNIFSTQGVSGATPSGEETLRVPGRYVEVPGKNVIDVDVNLSDGTTLSVQTSFDSIQVMEF